MPEAAPVINATLLVSIPCIVFPSLYDVWKAATLSSCSAVIVACAVASVNLTSHSLALLDSENRKMPVRGRL